MFEMNQTKQKRLKMKKSILSLFATLAMVGFLNSAYAEDAKKTDHSEHHQEGTPAPKTQEGGMGEHGMMDGKMDMEKMHSMMHDCMQAHKDGKMCEGQAMEQCQKGMDKNDCMKMMKKSMKKKK